MATLFARRAEEPKIESKESNLEGFLADLGEVSRKHGIAIGDGASLYVMEPEDYARSYLASDQSELTFA